MKHAIPPHEWFAFDNHKIILLEDPQIFNANNPWEREYMTQLLERHLTSWDTVHLKSAIHHCIQLSSTPSSRDHFIDCVLERLSN